MTVQPMDQQSPGGSLLLAGPREGDRVELPESVYRAVLQVVEATAAGKAVTVAPRNQMLTTQQAADLLGVSRPMVIKLIDAGELPAETPGTRRRLIELEDVLASEARRREAQYAAPMELAVDDDDVLIVRIKETGPAPEEGFATASIQAAVRLWVSTGVPTEFDPRHGWTTRWLRASVVGGRTTTSQ